VPATLAAAGAGNVTALLLALLVAIPVDPCLLLARKCRALVARCDRGESFRVCSAARGCINRYELKCGPWW
jgi:hypothetical protein